MTVTRRLKITTTRIRRLRVQVPGLRAFCPHCAREVETYSEAQAAEVLATDTHNLHQFITGNRVHALPTVSGSLRICRASLFPQSGGKDDTA